MTETVGVGTPTPSSAPPAQPIGVTDPTISVVICAYTLDRWSDIVGAIDSVRTGRHPAHEILLVVDHNAALLEKASAEFEDVRVAANSGERGLSGARNTGISLATGDVVAFLDDDAAAGPDWLERMAAHYADPAVLGVGGAAVPNFREGRPAWLPPEFDWVVGCSYKGQPTSPTPVRNFIGANMSFRRSVLELVGPFTDGIGRVGTLPMGCEETELCIRIRQAVPGGVLLYDPAVEVAHTVPSTRTTFSYFRSRCIAEGMSKAAVAGLVGADDALETERSYVRSTLPKGMRDGLRSIPAAGWAAGLGRAGAVVTGVALAGVGYVRVTTTRALAERRRAGR
jgi:GT2 family glycosyltransferase